MCFYWFDLNSFCRSNCHLNKKIILILILKLKLIKVDEGHLYLIEDNLIRKCYASSNYLFI